MARGHSGRELEEGLRAWEFALNGRIQEQELLDLFYVSGNQKRDSYRISKVAVSLYSMKLWTSDNFSMVYSYGINLSHNIKSQAYDKNT